MMITLQLVCWTKTVAVPVCTRHLSIFDWYFVGDFVQSLSVRVNFNSIVADAHRLCRCDRSAESLV